MKSLLDKSFVYTSAVSTDIGKTFARIRAKNRKAKAAEALSRQVVPIKARKP